MLLIVTDLYTTLRGIVLWVKLLKKIKASHLVLSLKKINKCHVCQVFVSHWLKCVSNGGSQPLGEMSRFPVGLQTVCSEPTDYFFKKSKTCTSPALSICARSRAVELESESASASASLTPQTWSRHNSREMSNNRNYFFTPVVLIEGSWQPKS